MMKLGKFFQIALLLLLAAGAQPAYSAFWQWSKTAGSNATADPSINWAEGMSPSSVNDSARAMMARAAEYRDDISGLVGTAGTSTAYTATSNQGLNATPVDGQLFSFTPHATNGDSATLAVDGGTAFALTAGGAAIPSGTLISGTPYTVKFKLSASAWVLRDFYGSPYNVPLGSILWSTLSTPPNSAFVAPSGQCISTTTYSAYWVALGSPASGSCSGGFFAVIDMRGRVAAGLDTIGGFAGGRLTSSVTGCGTAFTSIGAVCANGIEGQALSVANVPTLTSTNGSVSISVTNTGTNPYRGTSAIQSQTTFGGGAVGVWASVADVALSAMTSTGTASVTVTSTGTSGTAVPRVQPTIALMPYLRIL